MLKLCSRFSTLYGDKQTFWPICLNSHGIFVKRLVSKLRRYRHLKISKGFSSYCNLQLNLTEVCTERPHPKTIVLPLNNEQKLTVSVKPLTLTTPEDNTTVKLMKSHSNSSRLNRHLYPSRDRILN